jgi:hypothetical protein
MSRFVLFVEQIDGAFQRHDAKQLATFARSDIHFTAPSVHTDGVDALECSYMWLRIVLSRQPQGM